MDEAVRLVAACPATNDVELARVRARLKRRFGLASAPVRLGRYELRAEVGTGGCGTVWAAWDRILSREVAIKMLTREGLRAEALMREARALARLSHPHIVECFDVGVTDDAVYLVMALVRGCDLARWLAEGRRSRAEILATFAAAARGLRAAHDRGIVHRDFKPANVLVGDDGSVRVADFGLAAMLAGAATTQEEIVCDAPISSASQRRMGGTLRYMAPEQHEGRPGTAAVDVFAFSAALYEAFAGVPAFAGETGPALLVRKQDGELQRPAPGFSVPRDVLQAVRRGLDPDPDRRPSDLVAEIEALRAPRRRPLAAIVAGVATAGALAAMVLSRPADPCPPAAPAQLVPHDDVDSIAAYRERLAGAEARACEAWQRGEISRVDRDAELGCVARSSDRADALEAAFVHSSATEADRRLAALQLVDPATCIDAREAPPDATHAAIVRTVARASADNALLRPMDAQGWARAALEQARASGDPELEADALFELGRAQMETGAIDGALDSLQRAFWLATSRDRDRTAAAAATWLVLVTGQHRNEPEAARAWARHAESAIARGSSGTWIEAQLHTHRGVLATLRGDARVALADHERALAIWRELAGDDRVALTQPLLARAAALRAAGRAEDALASAREIAAIAEVELGEDDPIVYLAGGSAAAALFDLARHDEAERELVRAYEGVRRHFGADDRRTIVAHANLARMAVVRGEFAVAREHFVELLAQRRRALGSRHPEVACSLADLGAIETRLGHWREGEALLREAADIFAADPSPDARALETYGALATVAAQAGRKRETVEWMQKSLELARATKGDDHPDTLQIGAFLGRATAEAGDGEGGLRLLERAGTRLAALGRTMDVANVDLDRAVVLRKLGRHDEAARVAERSLAVLAASAPPHRIADAEVVLYKALEAGRREPARVRRLVRSACAFYDRVATEFPVQARECAERATRT